ncbi:hypothetical protein H310_12524 [Aphanomyces invadans]|uniref:Uncharacterized protein n=1 Tax=Aphanomyces invadans TaxID=157072 RepID=A0A024THE6_9STRA|nr:hypothetical protein H310_12524 [Aphanomyces invadans]ETV93473.1 hypothetical protein H310_12524 [Aphanomyces invadans]|eukprot:XP_008877815.1 hypothetical protein H310_12524 [Aphanomyces invadans]
MSLLSTGYAELKTALEYLHHDVAERAEKLRLQARQRRNKEAQVKLANITIGDFVLDGSIVQNPPKLAIKWRDPFQVLRVVTDFVMEVQELIPPFAVFTHHACRLKMYHEGGREVTEDLVDHIAFGDGGFHVERLEKV